MIGLMNQLAISDPEIFSCLLKEETRQNSCINLIASENLVSQAIMQATGSCLTNKYAEGYPNKRYYEGCKIVDEVESLAISRAKQLFQAQYVNVQPHSGASSNLAVYFALCQPGDTILGMSLNSGGHLTHGANFNLSGKWLRAFAYEVSPETNLIDYDMVEEMALRYQPKIILAGGSAYPRIIDFMRFRAIADKVGAFLWVDMAHFSGLVAADLFPNPLPYADVVTSTTHKTLRGPRSGMILSNNLDLAKRFDSAVFPGIQGGPLMHVIAAKAVCFKECLQPSFRDYMRQVKDNAAAMAEVFIQNGNPVTTNGTDTHLFLVNVKEKYGLNGQQAATLCHDIGIVFNKNYLPYDQDRATSGIRIGTPFFTSQGAKIEDCQTVARCIIQILEDPQNGQLIKTQVREIVAEIQNKARVKI